MAALLFSDAASYHEVCKKMQLLEEEQSIGKWVAYKPPFFLQAQCSNFLLHMQWYSSRVAADLLIRVGT